MTTQVSTNIPAKTPVPTRTRGTQSCNCPRLQRAPRRRDRLGTLVALVAPLAVLACSPKASEPSLRTAASTAPVGVSLDFSDSARDVENALLLADPTVSRVLVPLHIALEIRGGEKTFFRSVVKEGQEISLDLPLGEIEARALVLVDSRVSNWKDFCPGGARASDKKNRDEGITFAAAVQQKILITEQTNDLALRVGELKEVAWRRLITKVPSTLAASAAGASTTAGTTAGRLVYSDALSQSPIVDPCTGIPFSDKGVGDIMEISVPRVDLAALSGADFRPFSPALSSETDGAAVWIGIDPAVLALAGELQSQRVSSESTTLATPTPSPVTSTSSPSPTSSPSSSLVMTSSSSGSTITESTSTQSRLRFASIDTVTANDGKTSLRLALLSDTADTDGDGVSNADEFKLNTNPLAKPVNFAVTVSVPSEGGRLSAQIQQDPNFSENYGSVRCEILVDVSKLTASQTSALDAYRRSLTSNSTMGMQMQPPPLGSLTMLPCEGRFETQGVAGFVTSTFTVMDRYGMVAGVGRQTATVSIPQLVSPSPSPSPSPSSSPSMSPSPSPIASSSPSPSISPSPSPSPSASPGSSPPPNTAPSINTNGVTNSTTASDTSVSVQLSTGSDSDNSSGQSLVYMMVTTPSSGTLSPFPTNARIGGSVTYSPNPGFVGTDSFSYNICDSASSPLCSPSQTVTISVMAVNRAPTDIELSGSSVNENAETNVSVGSLTTVDSDSGNTFTYDLVSGPGDTDNAAFSLSGNALLMKNGANYEAQSSYSVRIRSTDQGNLFFEKAFVITINDVNEAPTISAPTSLDANEDGTINTISVIITDPDSTLSCMSNIAISSSNSTLFPAANMVISGPASNCTLTLTPVANGSGTALVTLTVSDGFLSAAATINVTINPVNDTPTDIAISTNSINENAGADATVGTVSTVDADAGSAFSYSLVAGTGDTDNAAFNISGDSLRLTASADFETKSSYSVRIRSTDSDSAHYEKALTISISDVNEAPTNIVLSSSTLPENSGPGATVGTLTTIDPDAGNTHTYWMPLDGSGPDNAAFEILGNTLRMKERPDFETKNSYSILIKTWDNGNEYFYKNLTITISDVTESGWMQEAFFKAPNPSINDAFGTRLAISGNTLVVGAPGEDSEASAVVTSFTQVSNDSLVNSGAAYVYRRKGAGWAPEAILKATNPGENDSFGSAISLSGDLLAIASPSEDEADRAIINGTSLPQNLNNAPGAGAVYVYSRNVAGGVQVWTPEAYVKAANADGMDDFGSSISLSGDSLAVGAPLEDENASAIILPSTTLTTLPNGNASSDSGAVYLYLRTGTGWVPAAYIKAANNVANLQFGKHLALSGDTLAVGTTMEGSNSTLIVNGTTADFNTSAVGAGAVYLYRAVGTNWMPDAYIKASNATSNQLFGSAVALSGDLLAVGATGDSSGQSTITNGSTALGPSSFTDSGAVFLYRRSGSTWTQEAYVKAANARPGYQFGSSVALNGNTLVVGSPTEDSNQMTITNNATASTDASASDAGAAYVYSRISGLWQQEAYIKAVNSNQNDLFGTAVGLAGDTIAVGAPGEDSNQSTITNALGGGGSDNSLSASGAAYVYRNQSRLFDPAIRVIERTSTSIKFAWGGNLGLGEVSVVVAPVVGDNVTPPACQTGGAGGSITLSPGSSTYNYSGLTPNSRYGFRFCSTKGADLTGGSTLWVNTLPTP